MNSIALAAIGMAIGAAPLMRIKFITGKRFIVVRFGIDLNLCDVESNKSIFKIGTFEVAGPRYVKKKKE